MVATSAIETERRDAIAFDDAALADLTTHFRGELIRAGDTKYDAARAIWNGAIDRHPRLIARCTGVADVRAAVRFARERSRDSSGAISTARPRPSGSPRPAGLSPTPASRVSRSAEGSAG